MLDSLLRGRLRSEVSLDREPASTRSAQRTLIVYLPGILAGARRSSQDINDIWLEEGDMLHVEYRGKRFRAKRVVSAVAGYIITNGRRYERIVFIGSSMGSLLAYDIVQRLNRGTRAKVAFVAIDAPTSARDFQSPLDKTSHFMRILPFGPIWNLLSRPVMKLLMVPPKDENVEPGVNRTDLDRRFQQMWDYPLSFYRDQILYMISHKKLVSGSLDGIKRFVYVRSKRDTDTVRQEAIHSWYRARQRITYIEADSTHVGFAERPQTWRKTFRQVFKALRE